MHSLPASLLLLLITLGFSVPASSAISQQYIDNADDLFGSQTGTGIQVHSDSTFPLRFSTDPGRPAHLIAPYINMRPATRGYTPHELSTVSWLMITGLLSLGLISRRRAGSGQDIEYCVKKTLSTRNPPGFDRQPLTQGRFLVRIPLNNEPSSQVIF